MSYNRFIGALGAIVGILSGCGSVDTYRESTYDDEKPIYCYQSLAGVECLKSQTIGISGGSSISTDPTQPNMLNLRKYKFQD